MSLRPQVVTPNGPVLETGSRPRRVCIVLLSGIGDVVHGLPLALDLKALDPRTHVTWVAEPAPAQVLAHHPAVDRVVVYRSRDGLRGLLELRRAMAGVRADLTLNVQRYLKSVWPALLSGAPLRVGLPPSKTRDGIRFAHTHVLAEGPWKHSQDLFLDFRWALGVDRDAPVRWEVTLSPEEEARSRDYFARLDGRPIASLVVASANPKKDWPAERWAALADALHHDFGFQVLLVGGPSAGERAAADRILHAAATTPLDALADSVRTLIGLVKGSSLVVAPDTGPLHIAHALEVPVVGIFGHTNPWRTGPWRHFRDLVVDRYTEPGDAPDPAGYLPREGRMATVTLEDVLDKVEVARCRYL
ncbi:MAG: glycosyltransferase family 9 protein [Longimicrobiales bacterium]|nr:glycosyltransferase family 9 protein [Longimicrobiales bacterium]